jgi:hypothetical protein
MTNSQTNDGMTRNVVFIMFMKCIHIITITVNYLYADYCKKPFCAMPMGMMGFPRCTDTICLLD